MIFSTPVIVEYMRKNLDKNETSLHRTIIASTLALRYIEVPLEWFLSLYHNDNHLTSTPPSGLAEAPRIAKIYH